MSETEKDRKKEKKERKKKKGKDSIIHCDSIHFPAIDVGLFSANADLFIPIKHTVDLFYPYVLL